MQIQFSLFATACPDFSGNGTNPHEFFHELMPQAARMDKCQLIRETIRAISALVAKTNAKGILQKLGGLNVNSP